MQILIFIYGLLIGSFLNVCIYRMPREESIAFPSSHCPKCATSLRWYNNIPLLSYIFLGGKCNFCKDKISIQYPLIESLNAIIYLFTYLEFGISLEFFFYAIIFSLLIVITMIDLQHMIIPDILVILILASSIIYKFLSFLLYRSSFDLLNSIGGLALSGLLFLLIIILSKGGMGGGDVTLIGALGFILGIKKIFLTIFLSFILGSIISIILLATKIKGRKDPIPFGPFIVLGFTIVVFWGELLINWYTRNFFY